MTRINTNVSSLIAQKTLARSNAELEQSLQRLSTGLRINSGKDDPAGLIASEILRSDIAATNVAISNCERANQMIATADSSLSEVGNLLIEIRSLVSEAANTGAMSADQIAANQLQVDSSLAAIDRIAQVTQFQGNRLLDGSLDFVTENVNANMLSDVQVHQANFGSLSEIDVKVDVVTQAKRAELTYQNNTVAEDLILTVAGNKGSSAFSFAAGTTVNDMASAINMVSAALGVTAEVDNVIATEDMNGLLTLGATGVSSTENIGLKAQTAGKDAGNYALRYMLAGTAAPAAAVALATTLASGTKLLNVNLKSSGYKAASFTKTGVTQIFASGNVKLEAVAAGKGYAGLNIKMKLAAFSKLATATTTFKGSIATAGAGATWTLNVKINATTLATKVTGNAFRTAFNNLFDNWVKIGAGALGDVVPGAVSDVLTFALAGSGTDAINAAATMTAMKNALGAYGGAAVFTASGGGASAVPTLLSQSAYYGSINTSSTSTASNEPNNYIQFVAPEGMSNIKVNFITGQLTDSLKLSAVQNSTTGGYSTAFYQGSVANTSFKIKAKNVGTEYDGTKIKFAQQATGVTGTNAVWDRENKTVTVYGDFTTTGVTAASIKTAINNNASISSAFTFTDVGLGTGTITGSFGSGTTIATTAGGNEYESITVNLATSNGQVTSTAADIISLVNSSTIMQGLGVSATNAFGSTGAGLVSVGSTRFDAAGARASTGTASGTTTAGNGADARITVTARNSGDRYDNVQLVFQNDATKGTEYVEYNAGTKKLIMHIAAAGTTTAGDVVNSLSNNVLSATALSLFSMTAGGNGSGLVTTTDSGYTSGGSFIARESALAGAAGGIHLLGNADEGDVLGTRGLKMRSTGYGSNAFVSAKASPQQAGQSVSFVMINDNSNAATRATGTNADVRINGAQAVSNGLDISIYTATVNLDFTLNSAVVDASTTTFRITGGGAQFQIGPDVISTQQARLGIPSINSTELGGTNGRMYQLQSGNSAALDINTTLAASIVEEAISQVTSLRGRLGSFQAQTLETTIETLTSAVENLTAAESSIRDTDFAYQSSQLTRSQILVSSGMSVLGIANQQPQNVLQLLQ